MKTMRRFVPLLLLFFSLLPISEARSSRRSSGPQYPGPKHTTSHGGTYQGGNGSSHKYGHYKNAKTRNQYGHHKK